MITANFFCKWGAVCLGVVLILVSISGCGDEGDIISPHLVVGEVESTTNKNPLTLTGTVEEGGTVEISVTPAPITIGAVLIEGDRWSSSLEFPDSSGTRYAVSVSAADPRGNRSTAQLSFMFDNVAEISLEQFVSPVRSEASAQTLAGTIEPGSTLTVEVDGALLDQEQIFVNVGTWQADLPMGAVIVIRATDALGNTAEVVPAITLSDFAIPLTISSFASPINETEQQVTISTGDVPAQTKVLLRRAGAVEDEEIYPAAGSGAYLMSGLVPGRHLIKVTATAENHIETVARLMLVVDQRSPVVSAVIPEIATVAIDFSEAVQGVDATTILLRDQLGATIAGTVTYLKDSKQAIVTPQNQLAYDTPYLLELVGSLEEKPEGSYIADLAGNPLLPNSESDIWRFSFSLPAPSAD